MDDFSVVDSLVGRILVETANRLGMTADVSGLDALCPDGRVRLGALLDAGLRRAAEERAGARIHALGPYAFDPAALALMRGADTVRLTEKERDILLALLAAPGHRIGRAEMLDRVWGYAGGVETHTLETHIYRLRQKMESDPAAPVLLLTDGDGYCLNPGPPPLP